MSHWKEHPASNRQLKVLRFFGIPFAPNITKGLAVRYIFGIFDDPKNRERWNKYVFLTDDAESESSELKSFDPAALEAVVLPSDWEAKGQKLNTSYRARAESLLSEHSPFDDPEPKVEFSGKHFCFTGNFEFGKRKACESAIKERGGIADDNAKHETDFLVIGKRGSDRFAKNGYGRKIEWAIVAKLEFGKPLIISEDHWVASLRNETSA